MSEHELAAALFFEPAYRRLWRDRISAGVKSRRKILSRLYHFDHLDPRLATRVSGRDRSPARLAVELRARRAPDRCLVIDAEDEEREMPLEAALEDAIGGLGGGGGAIVSCTPGRLAYLEGENIGDRYILERAA